MTLRLFYTRHKLYKREREKLIAYRSSATTNGQIKIRYAKKRRVEDLEFPSLEAVKDWVEAQKVPVEGMDDILSSYVTVYGVCEAKDGEKQRKLEDFFSAEEVLLL